MFLLNEQFLFDRSSVETAVEMVDFLGIDQKFRIRFPDFPENMGFFIAADDGSAQEIIFLRISAVSRDHAHTVTKKTS